MFWMFSILNQSVFTNICLPSLWSIKFDVLSFSSFKPDNHAFGQFCGFDSGLGHIWYVVHMYVEHFLFYILFFPVSELRKRGKKILHFLLHTDNNVYIQLSSQAMWNVKHQQPAGGNLEISLVLRPLRVRYYWARPPVLVTS